MASANRKDETATGRNRTGVQMSPIQIRKMLTGMDSKLAQPTSAGDEGAMGELRGEYIADAEPVGSVPPPGTMKGMLQSGAQMLTGDRPQAFLDKLGERLAFERTGTRLYDALLVKCSADSSLPGPIDVGVLQRFRNEEAKHFKLLGECIERLGGDPTAQTPCADVAGVESMGLMQVLTDPKTTIAQSLHAVLIGELADNVGWQELVLLAGKIGEKEMAGLFARAGQEEDVHLETIRKWHEQMTLAQSDLMKSSTA
jgi:rubrerythrin